MSDQPLWVDLPATERWHCQRIYRQGEIRGISYLDVRALPTDPRIINAPSPGAAAAAWSRGEGEPADPRPVLDTYYHVRCDDDVPVSVSRA